MISRELVAASAVPMVLSILSGGESYGYAIITQVHELSSGQMRWTDGMLYPVLHRLERQGLVRSRWGQSETGRKRKYYELTKKGRQALAMAQSQWSIVHGTLTQLWGGETPCLS
jgi:PadR family transcriptional regulator, regulatory protein PadR